MSDKIEITSPFDSVIVEKINVKSGDFAARGLPLIRLKSAIGKKINPLLRTKNTGYVEELLIEEGQELEKGQALVRFRIECPHSVVIEGMCADCGKDLKKEKEFKTREELKSMNAMKTVSSLPVIHHLPNLLVGEELALEMGQTETIQRLKQKKLVLLIDLDQTILHTKLLVPPKNQSEHEHIQKLSTTPDFAVYGIGNTMYLTKFRPGWKEFLAKMHEIYELHICTFGTRPYANELMRWLDPGKNLFHHRVLSRDEILDKRKKTANFSALFPTGDHMTVIIDDRTEVWNHARNMVKVKDYVYFDDVGDIHDPGWVLVVASWFGLIYNFSRSNPDDNPQQNRQNSEFTPPKPDSDDYLIRLSEILTNVHAQWYRKFHSQFHKTDWKRLEWDDLHSRLPLTTSIMSKELNRTLKDCVIALHPKLNDFRYLTYLAGRIMGARIVDTEENIDLEDLEWARNTVMDETEAEMPIPDITRGRESALSAITHYITNEALGVDKSLFSPRPVPFFHVCKPEWIYSCFEQFQSVDVNGFLVPFTRFESRKAVENSLFNALQNEIEDLSSDEEEEEEKDNEAKPNVQPNRKRPFAEIEDDNDDREYDFELTDDYASAGDDQSDDEGSFPSYSSASDGDEDIDAKWGDVTLDFDEEDDEEFGE